MILRGSPMLRRVATAANLRLMTSEQERWAEAATLERMLGSWAPLWVAGRIATLSLTGDLAGVERFRAIAERTECPMSAGRPS